MTGPLFASDAVTPPLPPGHRFPMAKYRRLREHLVAAGVVPAEAIVQAEPVPWATLALVHTPAYLERVRTGALTPQEERRLGLPWSPQLVERSRRSVGATLAASRQALRMGAGIALAGGTHHAYPDRGEGFCVFNDVAVALRALQADGMVRRALVLDLDVHQGNGTAAIFATDPTVFTFSIHGAKNFPFRKERSDLDVPLPDGADDDMVLAALETYVPDLLAELRPDLVVVLAGSDPFWDDRFGRLAMTAAGLAERDRRVYAWRRAVGVPVVTTMAGGYARRLEDTVALHTATVCLALGREPPLYSPEAASPCASS
jgi:acetoin utilization deacetylase AcuC-like enzyme